MMEMDVFDLLGYLFRKLPLLRVLCCDYYSRRSVAVFVNENYLWGVTGLDFSYLNDEILNSISRTCTDLYYLDVSFCLSITDQGLSYLCRLQHLNVLNLSFCFGVTDAGIILLTTLDCLEVLVLCECIRITDDSMVEIAEYSLQLSILICQTQTLQIYQ